jgi:hypothetical protein
MAVCIVDVDSEHAPTIQYGNMCVQPARHAALSAHTEPLDGFCRYRIDPTKYDNVMDDL